MTSAPPSAVGHTVDHGDGQGASGRARAARGAVVAVAVTVLCYEVLAKGLLAGWPALVLGCFLLLALPTSAELSRRVALNGSLLVGWVPVLWWWHWPVAVDHAALVLGVSLGALVGWVVAAEHPTGRLKGLVPRVRPADWLLPLGALAALAALWRWAWAGTPQQALEAMLPGADNYAHFHMFSTIRASGAVGTAVGPPSGGPGWAFDEYPQNFHALVATISELTRPHLPPGPEVLPAYAHGVVMVCVLAIVLLTAAILSVPRLGDRPLVALPLVVVTWAAFLWEPGQNMLADGFANFWWASAAVALALVLALAPERPLAVPTVASVCGLMVFVAHAWAPLLVIAAPAFLVLAAPVRTTLTNRELRPRLYVAVALLVLAGLGVLKAAVLLLGHIDAKGLVSAIGGVHGTQPLTPLVLLLVCVYVCVTAPAWVTRRGASAEVVATARRARLLVAAPIIGFSGSMLLLLAQMRTVGTSSYYFLKFFMGFELILAVLVPAICGLLLSAGPPASRPRWVRVTVSVIAAALATQTFGHFPRERAALLDADHSGTAVVGPPYSARRMATGILDAVDATSSADSFHLDYVALGQQRAAQAFYPDGWFHGALASLTRDAWYRQDVLRTRVVTPKDAAAPVRTLLTRHPDLRVVVAPRYVEPLRRELDSPELARRVVGWDDLRD